MDVDDVVHVYPHQLGVGKDVDNAVDDGGGICISNITIITPASSPASTINLHARISNIHMNVRGVPTSAASGAGCRI